MCTQKRRPDSLSTGELRARTNVSTTPQKATLRRRPWLTYAPRPPHNQSRTTIPRSATEGSTDHCVHTALASTAPSPRAVDTAPRACELCAHEGQLTARTPGASTSIERPPASDCPAERQSCAFP